MAGPLAGIRIVEFAGIGPGPFAAMMLGDHGAEVIRIERPGGVLDPRDPLSRNRTSIVLDTKTAEGKAVARDLCRSADGLVEGYRPGVMERLGLGPDELLADNPKLVYGRMTGWGQFGPYAHAAGHDINYIALSGVLHTIGRAGERPVPPVNYVGDFGGGGMMLAFGMVSALLAVKNGAAGQVIDCAMTDGSALIAGMSWHLLAAGANIDAPGTNMLDGAAHFYDTYACADGKFVSIGSIEPQFYALLRQHAGVADDPAFDAQHDKSGWPALKAKLAAIFAGKTRDEWDALLAGTDVCFAPVLSMREAVTHPHNVARDTFAEIGGATQPMPAPRYSGTATDAPRPAPVVGSDTASVMAALGYDAARIAGLRAAGAFGR
ncbi:CaiB/BaiF CoA-transferase family protein [Sphingomonas sp. SUN039]|uniref:CaiB/BaiF CoA transferase family protein n=1 Tax=Sphingomonas sp. SUN039 TaxID=2937787 RepID=UPI002164C17F|nr:CaiB/BaiF CoA-transferase family protein [Sphingomonas sp. SUN039]UVO55767.1 CoA transferase [Sphingomonas sp. SUN039]